MNGNNYLMALKSVLTRSECSSRTPASTLTGSLVVLFAGSAPDLYELFASSQLLDGLKLALGVALLMKQQLGQSQEGWL